jgi:signal transduction histidine kinase
MRLRIIAYGIAVLVVLMTVSIFTFRASQSRMYPAPSFGFFEQVVAAPDMGTRQRMVDEALEERRVAISIHSPDGTLLVTNVQPPLDGEAPPTVPLSPGLADAQPPFPVGMRPSAPFGRLHAIPPPLSPDLPSPPVGKDLVPPPIVFIVLGAKVAMRPLPPDTETVPFVIPLVVTLFCLVVLSFPVTAAMTRKLEALAETARRFGEGDLTQRADTSRGSDDLNRTAKAFNMMAERIAELRQRERELLANVSHELRTPMARMAVLLELMQTNPSEASRYRHELGRDLRELESLLERIIETFRLDLASPRALELRLANRAMTDLRDIATGVATDFRASTRDAPLTLELPEEPVIRQVDETLLRRAVMNLLDNARKYSPAGSPIVLTVEAAGDIVVRDHGDGIDAADLPHLFEPFFRADRSRNRATGGVGLGLGFVKMVAKFHDGDVSIESEPGAGCTFRLSVG